ncbi:MAG: beta-ketoacyl-[acyl-carrier-protein] synthase family protein [Planctomycetaceae bacterium]|nr:beta-ketoacyl-[acyl-carrier-protein] synthase family protein [Planctomycetaceae bacterium]
MTSLLLFTAVLFAFFWGPVDPLMDQSRQVVITGIGVVSPIGVGREPFWSSLRESQSGVTRLEFLAASESPVDIGAALKDFDGKQYIKPRKALKVMCREIQTACSAAAMAVADSGLEQADSDPDRKGAVFGSQMLYGAINDYEDLFRGSSPNGEFDFNQFGESFPNRMYPLWMLKNLPNMAACHIAIAHDARGPNNSIVLGEVGSLVALEEAVRVIQRDVADVMIVGGTGTRLELTGWIYRGALHLSRRNDQPTAASRPFDAQRDGMVNGEGAGALILESRQHAERRGAEILAVVHGFGNSFATDPSLQSQAIRNSIQNALKAAGADASDLGHVNAHGLSTLENDRAEATAIRDALGDVPVTAHKSQFGNLGAGGGAVELIGSVLALQHGEVPSTLNYENPDPGCPVNVIHGESQRVSKPLALKLSQSQTGQSVALLIGAND